MQGGSNNNLQVRVLVHKHARRVDCLIVPEQNLEHFTCFCYYTLPSAHAAHPARMPIVI